MVLVISELNQKDSHLHLNRHYSSSRTGIVNRLHSQFFTSYDRRHNLGTVVKRIKLYNELIANVI